MNYIDFHNYRKILTSEEIEASSRKWFFFCFKKKEINIHKRELFLFSVFDFFNVFLLKTKYLKK